METLSSYARQFIGGIERPDVDKIEGLSPSISIEQKTIAHNPRSTVGTVTEIYDFLRLLFARCGIQFSPDTNLPVTRQSLDQIFESVIKNFQGERINILSPAVKGRKGHYQELFEEILSDGFTRVRTDGEIREITEGMKLDRYKIHDIEIVIDRLVVNEKSRMRIYESLELGLRMGDGIVIINNEKDDKLFNEKLSDPVTGRSFAEPAPNSFSFNSPYGWCRECYGHGEKKRIDENLIFPDRKLSFAEGGIAPIGKPKKTWISSIITGVLEHYKCDSNTPIIDYQIELLDTLLFGTHEKITYKYTNSLGHTFEYHQKFGGIVKYIEQVSKDTSSTMIKNWAESFMQIIPCNSCKGGRLKEDTLWVKIGDRNIYDITQMTISSAFDYFSKLKFEGHKDILSKPILKDIRMRLKFLLDVGLEYLTIGRSAKTLSGGEAQRIRLATQIGSQLTGVLYILDEPSIGLHHRDNKRLIKSLENLRDIGNTVIVVEHDKDMIQSADYVVDLGPGAGEHGGEVVAAGSPKKLSGNSITADYLNGKKVIPVPEKRRKGNGKYLTLKGATGNNLKNVELKIPLEKLICITGVSGSGKSTIINDTLFRILSKRLMKGVENPLPYSAISGLSEKIKDRTIKIIDKVIEIDQSPIGRTPRSNPATYTGLFTHIRDIYASLPESKIRGYKVGRFSFNVKGGRCEDCEGDGVKKIEMNFLPDVYVTCDTCRGKRYNDETLNVLFKGKSISDVLEMRVEDAVGFFESFPALKRKLKTLFDVGLGYIRLGQQATTLSGGEAQRVKLASELSKVQTGRTIYILDEPTTGLHFEDINMLLKVLNKLADKGNTVIVIEHNLDVIKSADWVIDLGPEGGEKGGEIIAEGTPEDLVKKHKEKSFTAHYLEEELRS
jgi:excinuclease ABC subunit A